MPKFEKALQLISENDYLLATGDIYSDQEAREENQERAVQLLLEDRI
jgi:hypothetical protein